MITVVTDERGLAMAKAAIDTVDRLQELVKLKLAGESSNSEIVIEKEVVYMPLDWYDTISPYIFPKVDFTTDRFLALLFFYLGNFQKATEKLSENDPLFHHLKGAISIVRGDWVSPTLLDFIDQHAEVNSCLMRHYGNLNVGLGPDKVVERYQEALVGTSDLDQKMFLIKHCTNLLLDMGECQRSKKLLSETPLEDLSPLAKINWKTQNALSTWAASRQEGMDKGLVEAGKDLADAIQHYEEKGHLVNAGMLRLELAEILQFQSRYEEALACMQRAQASFQEDGLDQLAAETLFRKGSLLHNWSQNGKPYYFKMAIKAYQDAL